LSDAIRESRLGEMPVGQGPFIRPLCG